MRRGYPPKLAVVLTPEERASLEEVARQWKAPHLEVLRAKALLMAADGARNVDIAEAVGIGARTITIWRREFLERRLDSIHARPRSGRKRHFPP